MEVRVVYIVKISVSPGFFLGRKILLCPSFFDFRVYAEVLKLE